MSLKARLAVVNALQIIAVLSGILSFVYWTERADLLARATQERVGSLSRLAQICTATLDAKEEKILLSYLRSFMEASEVVEVGLWDREGNLQIHSDFLRGDYSGVGRKLDASMLAVTSEATRPVMRVSAAGSLVRDVAPVSSQGKRFGVVIVTYDVKRAENDITRVLNKTRRDLVLIGFAGCGLALVTAWLLAIGIVRPIGALSEAAREIGAGRAPQSLPIDRGDELGELARDLARMAERLRQLDEFKDHFLRAISHNMRSPLAAVESAAYHARHYVESTSPKVREDFRIIERGVKELTNFINNLLDVERLKAGRMAFRFEKADVRPLLDQSCDLYRRLAEEKDVRLFVRDEAPVRPVKLDLNLIGQAISNLVVNAVKFTPAGGQIELAAAQDGPGVRVTISDTGPGIPAEQLPEVFQKFRQFGESPKDARGSGLGLALCKEVVEAHGGRIWVENRPGGGARFSVWLPD